MTVDVVIPAYRPGQKFIQTIRKLAEQTVRVGKIIVVNTEEKLWPESLLKDLPEQAADLIEVHHISKEEFDHGHTRNVGVSYSDAQIVVLMTDDAVPYDNTLIEALTAPFSDETVGAVYGRQLPGETAGIGERFSRAFNYPAESRKKTIADLKELGIKTFFCSNVCAAYRRSVFDELGGFTDRAIFNEDMIYAAGLLDHGYAVCYAADACVIHSHTYTNRQQMQRNFDNAVSQAMHPEVFARVSSESEGIRFVCMAFAYFLRHGRPFAIFPFVITSACKYLGFRRGKNFRNLSHEKIMKYTMNQGFFEKLWSEGSGIG